MITALEQGIALGKANRRREAIEYLKQALLENPREVEAWMWISQLVDDRPTMKYCYKKILEIEPDNVNAKHSLRFLLDTDANLKFFPDPISPLQAFFESQQGRPTQTQARKPSPTPSTNSDLRPTSSAYTSRHTQSPAKVKKRKATSWVVYLLIVIFISVLLSIAMFFTMNFMPSDINYGFGEGNEIKTNIFTIGLIILQLLVGLVWGLYWIISGYAGTINLIKKGYLLEYIGCSIILAGIPLILPALLGPIVQSLANSIKDKNK